MPDNLGRDIQKRTSACNFIFSLKEGRRRRRVERHEHALSGPLSFFPDGGNLNDRITVALRVLDSHYAMSGNLFERLRRVNRLFLLTVAAPTLVAIVYFGLIASKVYVSESRFVVRSPKQQATAGLGFLLKSSGFGNAGEEIYAVQDYALSRDALRALDQDHQFRKAFSRPEIDFMNRFGTWTDQSFESLFKYYPSVVRIEHDTTSTITTLEVRAYTGEDARRINEQVLKLSEALVNRLNVRGQADLVRYAQNEVVEAETRARTAALELADYRNREAIVDPEKQAQVDLQLIAKLQDELIATRNQLAQLRAFTPQNPQIGVLQAREKSLDEEIGRTMSGVAGGRQSLAGKATRYQRLFLESQFADRQLAIAMASLQDARNEARKQKVYLERIVQPALPDKAIEPKRIRSILATFVLGLVAWGILTMLLAGVREHRD